MRKYHQQQLLELIKTLKEGNAEIRRLHSDNEMGLLVKLLSDCQESAIQIGGFIEQLEGEGTKTVSYLEEYCELLYQASIEVSGTGSGAGFIGLLQEQLVKIENSIKDELKPNKIEMVFLPYKAAMFDSFESMWLAAEEDPQCDAYVIPIPYFDRLPGGAFGQMHYEGDQYPDDVPITDWRKYAIEERHPDVIVIHSPYDDGNFVTSIHPDFYSKRLKDFTDLLVYIPYFVCVDDVQEHFCVCAGTLHADRVVVQSEKVRQTYLREFRKFERENNCEGRFGNAETKFVALGSPKFDKVLRTKREDCQIPEEWKKLIYRPDGTRKKVILYNTGISELLEGKDKVLSKLRHVFDCFRDRDDAVLFWRPHPLNITAYEAMRQRLLNGYMELVAEYRRQGFGIYDETADLHRAITVSDAYYGDWSSLVALYQCTGKPVMIQNPDVIPKNKGRSALTFENLYEDGENFWFTAYNFNALFKMDKHTWKAEYMGSFPGESPDGWRLYGSITEHGGQLYFAPGSAKEFAKYDLNTGEFHKIKFNEPKPQSEVQYLPAAKFFASIRYKDWIFFVGCSYPAFVRYNTITGQLDYFSDWVENVNRLVSDPTDAYFRQEAIVNGSRFTVAACNANALVVFDMDVCVSTVYEVGSKDCRYSGICFDGHDYWLSPRHSGPVVKWDPDTKAYEEYACFPAGFMSSKYSFWNINYVRDHVWLFPNKANMALKIDIRGTEICAAEVFQSECSYEKTSESLYTENYIMSKSIGNRIYAHTGKSNRLIGYDCKTGQRREEPILPSPDAWIAMEPFRLQALIKDASVCKTGYDCYFYENAFPTLDAFINYIVSYDASERAVSLHDRQIEIYRETNEQADGTSGAAIYAYCRMAVFSRNRREKQ